MPDQPDETFCLSLTKAETDLPVESIEYQRELQRFEKALRAEGATVYPRARFRDAISCSVTQIGEFTIPLISIAGPLLGALVVEWLKNRHGRQASLKIGNIEAKAQTPEDVEKLIRLIVDFRYKSKKGGI